MELDALPGIVPVTGQAISANESLFSSFTSVVDDLVTAHHAQRYLLTTHLQYDLVILPRVFREDFSRFVDACNGFDDT